MGLLGAEGVFIRAHRIAHSCTELDFRDPGGILVYSRGDHVGYGDIPESSYEGLGARSQSLVFVSGEP